MSDAPSGGDGEGKMHLTPKMEEMFSEPITKMNLLVQAPGLQDYAKLDSLPDEAVQLFFIFRYKTEYKTALLEAYNKHIVQTRDEEGNIFFNYFQLKIVMI